MRRGFGRPHELASNSHLLLRGGANRLVTGLFDSQSVLDFAPFTAKLFSEIGMNVIHFTVTDDGRFVLHSEPSDLDKYFEPVESPEIQAAMVEDGVERESVEIHVLDKQLAF